MGRRSESRESKHKSKKHTTHHSDKNKRRSRSPQTLANFMPKRPRISNFDRPPQPPELLKAIKIYPTTEAKPLITADPSITKYARRIYIENIHEITREADLRKRISRILIDWGGIIEPGDPVICSLFLPERRCMLMELRSVEETEAALTLNGMVHVSFI
jgi:hypothetical protein